MRERDLDIICCPLCSNNEWSLDVEHLGSRIHKGNISCDNSHTWVIAREILRFDSENDNTEPLYVDTPSTGFPNVISEQERLSFLKAFTDEIENLVLPSTINIISGDHILFFENFKSTSHDMLIVHEDERILRQIQEIVVSKLLYPNVSLIRANSITLTKEHSIISIFQPSNLELGSIYKDASSIISYHLSQDSSGEVLWEGEQIKFVKSIS